jgi:hypothetical protein
MPAGKKRSRAADDVHDFWYMKTTLEWQASQLGKGPSISAAGIVKKYKHECPFPLSDSKIKRLVNDGQAGKRPAKCGPKATIPSEALAGLATYAEMNNVNGSSKTQADLVPMLVNVLQPMATQFKNGSPNLACGEAALAEPAEPTIPAGGGAEMALEGVDDDEEEPFTQLHEHLLEDQDSRYLLLNILLKSGLSSGQTQSVFDSTLRTLVHTPDTGSSLVLAYGDPLRNLHACHFGWTQFGKVDIDFLVSAVEGLKDGVRPVVEMGCGSGWLAYLLRDRGVDVDGFDSCAEGGTFCQTWRQWPWFKECVQEGSTEVLAQSKYSDGPRAILLLCWPDVDSPFGANCLAAFQGNALIFVGEPVGGCTADKAFYVALAASWSLTSSRTIQRKASQSPELDPKDAIHVYSRNIN